MAKSKFFRVFVEGGTVSDGRKIEAAWIDQIVANFNTATYQPRINCEHIKGFSPDGPFNCYGDVVAVKAENIQLDIAGKTETRRALYAQLAPNDQLVAITAKGQKIFTSVELTGNYAGTGKVALVGLAVTDNPASLGTEALSFTGLKQMFDARKTAPENFFTAADDEVKLELEADDGGGLLAGIKSAIEAGFAKFTKADSETPPKPKDEPKTPPANDNDLRAFATLVGEQMTAAIGAVTTAHNSAMTALRGEFTALKTQLEKTEQPGFTRKPADGQPAAGFATDC